jgi:predicted polyphosphate/ATP-dependent NAD kinase
MDSMPKHQLGLIVNPIAGLGGPLALNGTDRMAGAALKRGAVPRAGQRATEALQALLRDLPDIEILCYAGEMGAASVSGAGAVPCVVGMSKTQAPTADDTRRAAKDLVASGIGLLLFAGGDGTACNLVDAIGRDVPVIGIPAGVKMHSGIFATTPVAAGALAARYLSNGVRSAPLADADILDADEAARRQGEIRTRLYGTLNGPRFGRLRQNPKAGGGATEPEALGALAAAVAASIDSRTLYFLGPGSTMAAVKQALGLNGTLLGVDAVRGGRPIGFNLTEREILALLTGTEQTCLIVSPLGGQGFVFGRGNQQIGATALHRLGRDNIRLVATMAKLLALHGEALLVDTGDGELDAALAGWHRVTVGINQSTLYRIAA